MRQLGELLGIAQTNISNWENAGVEPNYETLIIKYLIFLM
jgi:transcriptional regulator with XRE-family HTH domain